MTRIVRENYLVADLPEDLRRLFPSATHIRIVLESDRTKSDRGGENKLSLEELFAMRKPPFRSTDDIVAEVRQQRDEWDD